MSGPHLAIQVLIGCYSWIIMIGLVLVKDLITSTGEGVNG